MKSPTVAQFKKWSKDNASLGHAVAMAKAFAQLERERVDAYIKPIFDSCDFYVREEWRSGKPSKSVSADWRILDVDHMYLSDDEEQAKWFYAECDKAHRAHGFDGPDGYCPALIAENLVIKAENALLESASKFFCVDFTATYGEQRAKAIELTLGATLKAYSELRTA